MPLTCADEKTGDGTTTYMLRHEKHKSIDKVSVNLPIIWCKCATNLVEMILCRALLCSK